MILRRLSISESQSSDIRPAWPAFVETQEKVTCPCLLIPQAVHAVLAGDLALGLVPELFGPLPPDILEAIRRHDTGWNETDSEQIATLSASAQSSPVSFTAISPESSVPAWGRSIRHAEGISDAAAIIVSRHFCSLAIDGESHHRAFLEEETERRKAREHGYSRSQDLTRWLGALGFCDLLSLHLCSGSEQTVTLPLAHPNMPEAKTAPVIRVQCQAGHLHTDRPILTGVRILSLEAWRASAPGVAAVPEVLEWTAEG